MKYTPIISVLIVQQLAMIIFMRVIRLDSLFLSAGLSAMIAMSAGLIIYFVQRRIAARKGRV